MDVVLPVERVGRNCRIYNELYQCCRIVVQPCSFNSGVGATLVVHLIMPYHSLRSIAQLLEPIRSASLADVTNVVLPDILRFSQASTLDTARRASPSGQGYSGAVPHSRLPGTLGIQVTT